MFTTHTSGDHVQAGLYWCINSAEFVSIPDEGGELDGDPGNRYVMLPLPLVLTAGPLMGLAFIVFLPLSGLLVLLPFVLGKMRRVLAAGKISAAHAVTGSLAPGISYLEPRRAAPSSQSSAARDGPQGGKLFDLAREIAEKRWKEQ